ncbi:hypothetical protein CJA_3168 [Cellvibrio japonicus Ueda107]|uniref:Uncharacterized protein n=1 Tax=Cellvibrio japonicus (strain Ueda107) TaxID=498211 RepID=B3PDW5_CELJU|nr:hypothetical protein CJA_3168 [Cellvibrio japonicus Ueda107]
MDNKTGNKRRPGEINGFDALASRPDSPLPGFFPNYPTEQRSAKKQVWQLASIWG